MIGLLADPFRDSIWQFVAAIVGILALIGTILFGVLTYRVTRRRKSLTYEVLSTTSLARLHDDVEGRVQILFDGQPVRDVRLALMRITNSGNQPIGSKDFERPLTFSINEEARILSAGVTRTVPDRLGASIQYDHSSVTLQPLLLNNGDSVTINVLATQFDGEVSVDGRIIGVKEIERGQRRISTVQGVRRLWMPLPIAAAIIATLIYFLQINRVREGVIERQEQAIISIQHDVEEVKHVVRDSQICEVLDLYSNPYTSTQLDKFWIQGDKGGQAAKQIQDTIQTLRARQLRYDSSARNERFDFKDVQVLPSRDTAYVLTDEEWYLPERKNVFAYQTPNLKVGGLYVLKKQNDTWLILQEGTEKARIRYRY